MAVYSNTCMTYDLINTDAFLYLLYTKHERALACIVPYQASVSRDSLTANMLATTNITRFYDISTKPQ